MRSTCTFAAGKQQVLRFAQDDNFYLIQMTIFYLLRMTTQLSYSSTSSMVIFRVSNVV